MGCAALLPAADFGLVAIADCGGLLVHTTSWAMMLVNFDALSEVQRGSARLDDARCCFHPGEFLQVPRQWRSSSCDRFRRHADIAAHRRVRTDLPAAAALIAEQRPVFGSADQSSGIRGFISRPRRSMRSGAGPSPSRHSSTPGRCPMLTGSKAIATTDLLRRAALAPRTLLRLYGRLPRWSVLRAVLILLFRDVGRHWAELWRKRSVHPR